MNKKCLIILLSALNIGLLSCVQNNNSSSRANDKVLTKELAKPERVETSKDDNIAKESVDTFEYKNDTIIQRVLVRFISKNKIKFKILTINRLGKNICELSDTAHAEDTGSLAMYNDEKYEDDPYGAREYIYNKKGNYISIGIDDTNRNRLFVNIADSSAIIYKDCSFNSLGTLRKK